MEALTLLLDCIVVLLLVYMGMRDERRRPGTPATSLFRAIDADPVPRPKTTPGQAANPAIRPYAR